MSSGGYQGRGFRPRGARSNGLSAGSSGSRYERGNFNREQHSWHRSNRLPSAKHWRERPPHKIRPWQEKTNFSKQQYRGNLRYPQSGRGRVVNDHGVVRFPGPGRPPGPPFSMGVRNSFRPRPLLQQEEQVQDKPPPYPQPSASSQPLLLPQIALPGSEEERQQKISETADKLKQKLSSITVEELTNFWENELPALPETNREENIRGRGIPVLRHEPPELNLTFTDFRDIGRVDDSDSKLDDVKNVTDTTDVTIIFEKDATNSLESTNEIITLLDDMNETLQPSDSMNDNEVLNVSTSKESCQVQQVHKQSNSTCSTENTGTDCRNNIDNIQTSCENGEKQDTVQTDVNINMPHLNCAQPIENADTEVSTSINNVQQTKIQDQNVIQAGHVQGADFIELTEEISQMNKIQTDCPTPESLHISSQNNSATEELLSEIPTHLPNTSLKDQLNTYDQHTQDHSNIYEPPLQDHLNYNRAYILDENRKPCNPHDYQVPPFNDRPRFGRRKLGSMIRLQRPFHQTGKSLFMQGSQRLPMNQNPRLLLRHPMPCLQSNLARPIFDSWALPQFKPNVVSTNHEAQGHALLPYPPNTFPPNFDPTEPPPNLRTVPISEISPGNDVLQNVPPLDRNVQFPIAFNPREPTIRITNIHPLNDSLSNFNHQQLQQNVSNQEDPLQRSVPFDPMLSHQEHPNVMIKSPLDTSGSNALMNLVDTSRVSDFSMGAYPQIQSMNIPPAHQPFIPPVGTGFHHGFPHSNTTQVIKTDCTVPMPLPMNMTDLPAVAPPLPEEPPNKPISLTEQQNPTIDDGLEDMHEAMEFAKTFMSMTDEADQNKNDCPPEIRELPVTDTVSVAVPNKETNTLHISLPNEVLTDALETSGLTRNTATDDQQEPTCVSKGKSEKQKTPADTSLEKNREENLSLIDDQIRPKVVFNLNSRSKRISKAEEWCMQNEQTWQKKQKPLPIVRNKESPSYVPKPKYNEGKIRVKKDCELKKNYSDKNSSHRKKAGSKKECTHPVELSRTSISQKSSDNGCESNADKPGLLLSSTVKSSNITGQKFTNSKIQIKKLALPASESSWKSRVINRFLKMSKNDICNMVNNSSLRKFDIAMKHLVKEKRSSISLEIRNTENEKMKEYDRDEFMTQLNAMLDPGAVVDISNLPTEFIHHLSEVLQLDPMPFGSDVFSLQQIANNQLEKTSEQCNSSDHTLDSTSQQHILPEHNNTEIETETADQITANVNKLNLDEILSPITTAPENMSEHVTEENSDNDMLNVCEKSRRSTEKHMHHGRRVVHKKHQPLFNVADLDDILSDVGKCRSPSIPRQESKKSSTEERRLSTSNKLKLDNSVSNVKSSISNREVSPRLPNRSRTDLDDIFSIGFAKAKLENHKRDAEHFRSRKSTSEDRSTFRTEKYERWNRKERVEPDAFRNLTKEEWEAKYGKSSNTDEPSSSFKHRNSCDHNVSSFRKEYRNYRSQRHCLSDSPMRNLSMSPIARENIVNDTGRHSRQSGNYTEDSRREESNSDGDSSSSSSSTDSYDEVAPDVTKLLKVIKQNENIGKKKSLNETIRDEVTAEIERKWKEKGKYRERRSYKHDKRRKIRKWQHRKERTKWKKRSEEITGRNSEETLLTEDQIKKEVIVKQEMESEKFDDLQDGSEQIITNDPSILDNIATESSGAVRLSQTVEEFITPTTCSSIEKEDDGKLSTVLTKMQPKTKAQLKQILESPDIDQDQVVEGMVQSQTANTDATNTNLLTRKEDTDKAEINSENTNQRGLKIMSTHNNSLNETNKPLIISNVPTIEARSYTLKCKNMESLASDTVSSTTDIATSNQQKEKELDVTTPKSLSCAEKAIITDSLSISTKSLIRSIENRTGSKKIDIKAYKERALLKRLKENDRSKEIIENSVSSTQDLLHAPATNKNLKTPGNVASPIDVNQTKAAESSGNYGLKEEVQINNDSIPVSCHENSSERLVQTDQSILQAHEQALFPASARNVNSISNSDTTIRSPNVEPSRMRKEMSSSSSQKLTPPKQGDNKFQEHESMTSSTENSIGKTKFENIKSEGQKELKLKKEKGKDMGDRKKSVDVRQTKPSNITPKKEHLETDSTNALRDISTEKMIAPQQKLAINENISSENSGFMIRDACNIKRSKTENNRADDQNKNTSTFDVLNMPSQITVKHTEQNPVQEPPNTANNQVSSSPQERHKKTGNEINVKKSTEPSTSTSFEKLNEAKQFASLTETYADSKLTLNENILAEGTLQQNTMDINNEDKSKNSAESARDTDRLTNLGKDKIVTPDNPETPFKGVSCESAEVPDRNNFALLNTDKCNEDEIREKDRKPIVISNKEFTSDKRQVSINAPSTETNRLEIKVTCPVNQTASIVDTDNSTVNPNCTRRNIAAIEEQPKPEEVLAGEDYLNINNTQEEKSLLITDQVHQYSTDDENEPFIVLDEYIDDTDGRSNGRLSISEPELEDCLARDADAYLNKNTQQKEINLLRDLKSADFHAINFTVLSEVSCQEDEVVHKEKNDTPKNKDNEGMSITNAEAKLTNTTILQPRRQDRVKNAFIDVPQVPVPSNSIHSEIKKTIHATPQCSNEPSEIKQKSETVKSGRVDTGRNVMAAPKKLNVPTKAALKESVENVFMSSIDVPKVNTSLEKSTEGKSKIHTTHHSHREKDKEQEVTNNSKSKTNITVQKALSPGSSNVRKSSSSNTHQSRPVELEKMKEPVDAPGKKHNHTGESDGKTETFDSSNRSDKRQDNSALHKTKNRQRMKHKKEKVRSITEQKIKEVVRSDIVKMGQPMSKESIMARMIEIDVEIHKLMTEKMELYQIIEKDRLLEENTLNQNATVTGNKQDEITSVRPHTPSALMSKLIQNIEVTPAVGVQTISKGIIDSTKNNSTETAQNDKHKAPSKHEQNTHKRNIEHSSSDENGENRHYTGRKKSQDIRKRDRNKIDRAVRWQNSSAPSSSIPSTSSGKKQLTDKTKSILKRSHMEVKQELTGVDAAHDSVEGHSHNKIEKTDSSFLDKKANKNDDDDDEVRSKCNQPVDAGITSNTTVHSNKHSSDKSFTKIRSKTNEKNIDSTASPAITENDKSQQKEETETIRCRADINNKKEKGLLNEENACLPRKIWENKTLERPIIYSDDSTWDSCLQNPGSDTSDQRKVNTGLALLEETYRKEMAKSRRLKTAAKKNKRKQLQNISNTTDALTMDEEELPLSRLYIKKLQQKKDLLHSICTEGESSSTCDDPKLWENVVEVINAVAEDRVQELYVDHSKKQSEDNRTAIENVADVSSTTVKDKDKEYEDPETSNNSKSAQEEKSSEDDTPTIKVKHDNHTNPSAECEENSNIINENVTNSNMLTNDIAKCDASSTVRTDESQATKVIDDQSVTNETAVKDSSSFSIEETANQINEICSSSVTNNNNITLMVEPACGNASVNKHKQEILKGKSDGTADIDEKNLSLDDTKNTSGESNDTSKAEHIQDLKELKGSERARKESEQSTEISSEDYAIENGDKHKSKHSSRRRSYKRERTTSKNYHRRSKQTEENTKKPRLELDSSIKIDEYDIEKERPSSSNSSKSPPPLIPYNEEAKNVASLSSRKSNDSMKIESNRKRGAHTECEASSIYQGTVNNTLSTNTGPFKHSVKNVAKKHKANALLEIKNCEVRLVDSKYSILKPNVEPNMLRRFGISRINQVSSTRNPSPLISDGDASNSSTKEAASSEAGSHYTFNSTGSEDTIESTSEPNNSLNSNSSNVQQPQKKNSSTTSTQGFISLKQNSDVEVIPVLEREQITDSAMQTGDKPELEVLEHKNQHQHDAEPIMSVIEKDDTELPRTHYTVHKGPILDIKVFGKSFLAASEDGTIYRYSQASNGILNFYKGHRAAVTCLHVYSTNFKTPPREWLFSGSLDGTLRCYNITTGLQIRDTADVNSPIQCMDQAWGIIYIGTNSGHVSRYHIKSGTIKGDSIQFSEKSVLALKATNEGPRRVLIVASRNQPITIRDAQNGLFLRTICGHRNHTVYSLMRDNNLIYCGTSSTSIPVFDFTNGEQTMQYDAGVGIVCMRLYHHYLFAGCYDGNIYVFDTRDHRLICSIPGPGNMLLSMEVVGDKIIAGSKDKRLQSWQMPKQVRVSMLSD